MSIATEKSRSTWIREACQELATNDTMPTQVDSQSVVEHLAAKGVAVSRALVSKIQSTDRIKNRQVCRSLPIHSSTPKINRSAMINDIVK